MSDIAKAYSNGQLKGWTSKTHADQCYQQVKGLFLPFRITKSPQSYLHYSNQYYGVTDTPKKMFLYRAVRKALDKDLININQLIGDCVSWGARNATDYLACCEIILGGEAELYRPSFAPYFYGTGRVFVGNGQLDGNDGSTGAWMAAAVIKYGMLNADADGVPAYSASVAKKWGDSPGPPKQFVDIGVQHLIKSAAAINSWDELCAAIGNGYPCTIASNVGYEMEPGSDGFHRRSGNWSHQMCCVGYDNEYKTPYALIRNSWSDVHGHLKSFDNGEDMPVGYLRVKRADFEYMISSGECFAYSSLVGFPARDLDRALFDFVGR